MPIVKHNWIVKDVSELARIVREAFVVAQSGRPGPVLIDIPKNICSSVCEYNGLVDDLRAANGRAGRLLKKTSRETFNNNDIENACGLIECSKHPVIYSGGGVIRSGAGEELKKLAELLNAPVVMSLMGMGAIPSGHALCAGLVGMYGSLASNKAVQKADLIIAAGARFSDRVTGGVAGNSAVSKKREFAPNAKIIHIDIDEAEINKNIYADVFVAGDLKQILTGLLNKLPANIKTEWKNDIEKWKLKETVKHSAVRKKYLHPRFIIEKTAEILGDKAIAATDAGQHQIWTAQFYPFKNPGSFLTSGGMGTMGFGLGASAGAKIANPDRPVVLFTGDGSFRMNCAEMSTLVKYRLPVLIIIFNNQSLGMLRQWQNLHYESNYSQTDLEDCSPDFIKLAAAYDVAGFHAADKKTFLEALNKSADILASGKPVLIETIIDKDEKVMQFKSY